MEYINQWWFGVNILCYYLLNSSAAHRSLIIQKSEVRIDIEGSNVHYF